MTLEVRVPQLPESVADATLVTWHKKPGDRVSRDENLADLETDKVVLEVPAMAAGVLTEIKVPAGSTVTSGVILAIIEEGEATASVAAPAVVADPAAASSDPAKAVSEAKLAPAAKRIVAEKERMRAARQNSQLFNRSKFVKEFGDMLLDAVAEVKNKATTVAVKPKKAG